MASRQSQRRLTKEYKAIQQTPPPYITAKPNDENILEWHYIITGPPNTPFEHGQYHGLLRFPQEYPFKPPSISMITPNGRFACNTRLCLSMSDYHPDTWNPAWSVATILTGLLSFMTGEESTTGSITTSENVRRKLARDSKKWNVKENPRFVKQFPNVVQQNKEDIARAEAEAEAEAEAKKQRQLSSGRSLVTEKAIDLSQLDKLDPEDRARLLIEHERQLAVVNKTANGGASGGAPGGNSFGGFTALVGILVAAFLAAYFGIMKTS
ncbi:UBC6 [Candida theae]|uniref:Ubiquitin-conjugating enzyme E2 6 n=1 Tax=Candida theae TaxID=1198502 RepID=A0AAD5B9W2_9ASCO|nr:UBC6 [Candida theae]KAI5948960.1 UBC6 [Candida theae]